MFTFLINSVKMVLLAFIKASPPSIVLRIVTSLVLSFFIIPWFFEEFSDSRIKAGLFLLSAILFEMLATKLQFITAAYNNPGQSLNIIKTANNQSATKELNALLKRKSCLLFLAAPRISVENLLTKANYNILNFEDLKSKKIQVFDSPSNTIISWELEEYTKSIRDPQSQWLMNKLTKCLKNNSHPSITIVLSALDLIRMKKDIFTKSFDTCLQFVLNNFPKKLNLNLLIDNLNQVKGFEAFTSMLASSSHPFVILVSFSNLFDKENTTKEFREKFNQLLRQMSEALLQNKTLEVKKFQLAYIFSQQIKYLQEPLEKFLECLTLQPKKFSWQKRSGLLLTVSFISSAKQGNTNPPIMLEEWQSCIEEIESK